MQTGSMTSLCLCSKVMSSPTVTLREIPSVRSVCQALSDPGNCHSGYPVTDEHGKFRGLILRSQLLVLLRHKVRCWVACLSRLFKFYFSMGFPNFLVLVLYLYNLKLVKRSFTGFPRSKKVGNFVKAFPDREKVGKIAW